MDSYKQTHSNQEDRPIKDCYKSISAPSTGIYKDNSSKFLAFAYPVENEAEIKDIISNFKKEYFDARHRCYAYRLGHLGDIWRANDDGEPSSTAGKPIHGQLLSNELSDILVVVVRYFGGIKLGVPGLIRAYKTATAEAINNARIIEKIASVPYQIRFEYEKLNEVMKILKALSITPKSQNFDNECIISTRVRLKDEGTFTKMLESIATAEKEL